MVHISVAHAGPVLLAASYFLASSKSKDYELEPAGLVSGTVQAVPTPSLACHTLSSCHFTASACVPLFSGPPDLMMTAMISSTAQPCQGG